MIKTNYESSITSLMQQVESHKQKLNALRNEDISASNIQLQPKNSIDYPAIAAKALQAVSNTQMESKTIKEAYERGEDVPLTEVVLSMQKSSLAFESTLQVRNKVLKAYDDIMNMPV